MVLSTITSPQKGNLSTKTSIKQGYKIDLSVSAAALIANPVCRQFRTTESKTTSQFIDKTAYRYREPDGLFGKISK
jgi:hypothetical protein